MSQLLSACSSLQGIPPEDKKSRRTLFVSEAYIDAPTPKRQRTSDSDSNDSTSNSDKFVHSFTSPFKPLNNDKCDQPRATENSPVLKQASPEQKILLERKKQAKLLEEQKNFQLEDERWKRMEHELDKAFAKNEPKVTDTQKLYERIYPSVGIQASLIADISPLKPLSQCVNNLQTPVNGSSADKQVTAATTSTTGPASLQNMMISPLVNNTSNAAMPSSNAYNLPNGNVKLVSLSSANLPPIWKMTTCSVPSMSSNQPIYLTVPQQQQLSSTVYSNGNFASTPMQTVNEGTSNCAFNNMMQSNTAAIQPTTVSLPMNIVNTLNAQGLLQNSVQCQDGNTSRPVLNLCQQQSFTPRMNLNNMTNLSGVRPMTATPNQMTPILPKVAPQQMFTPMASATPVSNATAFMPSEIVKKLVMPETKMTQS